MLLTILLLMTGNGLGPTPRDLTQNAAVPLIVERAWLQSVDGAQGSPGRLSITIRNNDKRTVAAWGIWVETRMPNGAATRRNFVVDTVETEPAQRRDAIQASGTVTTATLLEYPYPYDNIELLATPAFAIFADDTAVGDETLITSIFGLRAQHQRFWHFLNDRFADIAARQLQAPVAVTAILSDLESISDPQLRDMALAQWARRQLSPSYLAATKQDAATALQHLIRQAADRILDADAHVTRRY